jgi:phosphonate transport system permease protein
MTLDALYKARPKDRVLRGSLAFAALLFLGAVGAGDFALSELWSPRALRNLARFLDEIRPTWTAAWWREAVPFNAVSNTLALAVAATGLATGAGAVLSMGAAATVTTPEPWLPSARPPSAPARWAWHGARGTIRFVLMALRAIPEYVWAFLLVALLGLGAWPAVLALALHNAGILGKLFAETIEDQDPAAPRALRSAGAGRLQIVGAAVIPTVLNRWLLYIFVRWETCIREATVVGMLGVVSLGWFVRDARSRTHYDEMVALIAVGAALILIGDAVSVWLRGRLRTQ